jgi:hypothetical protein
LRIKIIKVIKEWNTDSLEKWKYSVYYYEMYWEWLTMSLFNY